MDAVDAANDQADAEREKAVDAVLKRARPARPTRRERCRDCGEPIGAARLAALPNAARCIDCAELEERLAKVRA